MRTLLGLDHKRLQYRFEGRRRRLSDGVDTTNYLVG
jgi:hypothetical protein